MCGDRATAASDLAPRRSVPGIDRAVAAHSGQSVRVAAWLMDLPARHRAWSLLAPVAVATVVFAVAPLYSDEDSHLAAAPLLAVWAAALVAMPGAFMLVFVRMQLLWMIGLATVSIACVIGPVATVRSDDAQAGLAMMWIPYVGAIAALVLSGAEWVLRRRRRTSP